MTARVCLMTVLGYDMKSLVLFLRVIKEMFHGDEPNVFLVPEVHIDRTNVNVSIVQVIYKVSGTDRTPFVQSSLMFGMSGVDSYEDAVESLSFVNMMKVLECYGVERMPEQYREFMY